MKKKNTKILVINAGSSSLKYKLFDGKKQMIKGEVDAIGLKLCQLSININKVEIKKPIKAKDHKAALDIALKSLLEYKIIKSFKEIDAIGHRFAHGGEKFIESTLITKKTLEGLKKIKDLAPLHNPHNLASIIACKKLLPKIKQVAVFDTSFHKTIPEKAYRYGLPNNIYKKYSFRRYGFHGPSHEYVSKIAIKLLRNKNSKIISCHLGNGSSISAIKNGKSIDTSMGFSPISGIMMGSRTGNLDPMIPVYLAKDFGLKKVEHLLNEESGLKGITGKKDMRDIHSLANKGNKNAKLAINMLSYQIAFYIGAFINVLEGVDAIVFTAGIGEHAFYLRKKVLDYFKYLGLKIDLKKNKKNEQIITQKSSKIKVFVIPTNEEVIIAEETRKVL